MRRVPLKEMSGSIETLLKRHGYPDEERKVILDVLLYAISRGNFQFAVQVSAGNFPSYHAEGGIAVVRETPLSLSLDGRHHYGIVVMEQSMRAAIRKANEGGFGIVSSFHSASPGTGALGYYVEKIAEKGLIGFAFSGSGKRVAMHGSTKPALGSNPIAIGIPSGSEPLVIDFSTAEMPVFKLVEAKLLGGHLDVEGVDSEGQASFDPEAVLKGALHTFGGKKGSALALGIEALVAPLTGAAWVGKGDADTNWGNLIFAIDPALVIEKERFFENMNSFLEDLRRASSAQLPGERGQEASRKAWERGYIEMDEKLYEKWMVAIGNG